jgi:hypothetical protein
MKGESNRSITPESFCIHKNRIRGSYFLPAGRGLFGPVLNEVNQVFQLFFYLSPRGHQHHGCDSF